MEFKLLIFTLGFVPGMLLRLAPFKKLITIKQWITLVSAYTILLAANWYLLAFVYYNPSINMSTALFKNDVFAFGILVSCANILILRKHIKEQIFTCGLIMLPDYSVNLLLVFPQTHC